jgi:hypothetical protein
MARTVGRSMSWQQNTTRSSAREKVRQLVGLAARVREARITTLERFRSVIGEPMEKLDFRLVLTGDDICRTPRELHNTMNGPWSREAVQYALRKVRDTGRSKPAVCAAHQAITGCCRAGLTDPPYQMQFDTSLLTPNAWHIITAAAYDNAGHRSEARQMMHVIASSRVVP